MLNDAKRKPRKWLPELPIKTFAGGKLKTMNAAIPPRSPAKMPASRISCFTRSTVKNEAATIKDTPPQRPSPISIRLKALVIPIIHKNESA